MICPILLLTVLTSVETVATAVYAWWWMTVLIGLVVAGWRGRAPRQPAEPSGGGWLSAVLVALIDLDGDD